MQFVLIGLVAGAMVALVSAQDPFLIGAMGAGAQTEPPYVSLPTLQPATQVPTIAPAPAPAAYNAPPVPVPVPTPAPAPVGLGYVQPNISYVTYPAQPTPATPVTLYPAPIPTIPPALQPYAYGP